MITRRKITREQMQQYLNLDSDSEQINEMPREIYTGREEDFVYPPMCDQLKKLFNVPKNALMRTRQGVVYRLGQEENEKQAPKVEDMLHTIRQTKRQMEESLNIGNYDRQLIQKVQNKYKNFNLDVKQLEKLIKFEQNIEDTKVSRKNKKQEKKQGQQQRKKNLVQVYKKKYNKPHLVNPRLLDNKKYQQKRNM